MKQKDIKNNYRLSIMMILTFATIMFMLFYGLNARNFYYLITTRTPRIVAIILSGICIGVSSLIFQTISGSRILTPSVMGLDAMFVFFQTVIVFFSISNLTIFSNNIFKFFITLIFMVTFSLGLQKLFTGKERISVIKMVLIGMVAGTFLQSMSTAMELMLAPTEFLILQSSLFASFAVVDNYLLILSIAICSICLVFIFDDIKNLDVLSLGYFQSINLGLDYKKVVKRLLIATAILVSVSTALVGPITFLGLLAVNISREFLKTYKHKYLAVGSILVSIFFLIVGQIIVERIFNYSIAVSIIINFIGCTYLLVMLLKGKRKI